MGRHRGESAHEAAAIECPAMRVRPFPPPRPARCSCLGLATSLSAGQRGAKPPAPAAPPAPLFEVFEQSILELQAAQTDGRVTSRGLVESYLARIRAYDQAGPRLNAVVILNPRRRRRGRRARSRARRDRPARPAARHPGAGEGQLRHRRPADLGRGARPGHAAAGRRRLPGQAPARRRRGDPRQDDDARAGGRHHHHLVADRPDPQPVRPAPACRADRAAAPARPSAPASRPPGWAATPADRSASPRRTRTWSGCAGRRGCRAAPA